MKHTTSLLMLLVGLHGVVVSLFRTAEKSHRRQRFALVSALLSLSLGLSATTGTAAIPVPAEKSPNKQTFLDAQFIAAIITAGKPSSDQIKTISEILKTHSVNSDADVESNPFLRTVLGTAQPDPSKRIKLASVEGPAAAQQTPVAAFAYNLPTAVADLFGTAIADQAKTYLISKALQFAQKEVKRKQLAAPISILFPTTYSYLEGLSVADTVNPGILTNLRENAKEDLAAVPTDLDDLAATFDPKKDLSRFSLHIVTTAGKLIYNKQKPGKVIDGIEAAGDSFAQDAEPDARHVDAGLKVITIVSHLLLDPSGMTWITAKEVKACLNGASPSDLTTFTQLALGLSYGNDPDLFKSIATELRDAGDADVIESLAADGQRLAAVEQLVLQMTPLFDDLRNDVNDLNGNGNTTVDLADLKQLVADLQKVLSAIPQVISVFSGIDTKDLALFEKDLSATTTAASLIFAAKQKNYTLIWQDAMAMIQIIMPPDPLTDGGKSAQAVLAFFQSGVGKMIIDLPNAKNNADVQEIIKNDLNGGDNYEAKQLSYFSIDLNGYFGIEAGNEVLEGSIGNAKRAQPRTGIFAPVGVDFTWGMDRGGSMYNNAKIGSVALFVSVIDVGAVASWRAGGGTGNLPSVTWNDIVAPGVFVAFEFRDMPFVIMLGSEYGPALRSVSSNGIQVQKQAFQLPVIAFAFDASFANFFRSNR